MTIRRDTVNLSAHVLTASEDALKRRIHRRTNSSSRTISTTTFRHGSEISFSQRGCAGVIRRSLSLWQHTLALGDFTVVQNQLTTGSTGGNDLLALTTPAQVGSDEGLTWGQARSNQ